MSYNPEEASRIVSRRYRGVNRGVDPTDVPLDQFFSERNMITDEEIGEVRTRDGFLPVTTDIFPEPFAIMPGVRGQSQVIVYNPPPPVSGGTLKLSAFPSSFEVNGGATLVTLVVHGGGGLAGAPSYSWDFLWPFGEAHVSDQSGASTSTSNSYTVADVGIKYVHVQLLGDDGVTYTAWVKLTITEAGQPPPVPPFTIAPPSPIPSDDEDDGIEDGIDQPPTITVSVDPEVIKTSGDPAEIQFSTTNASDVLFTDPENLPTVSLGKTSGVISLTPIILPGSFITYLLDAIGPGGVASGSATVTLDGTIDDPTPAFITIVDPGPQETGVALTIDCTCHAANGDIVPFPFVPVLEKVVDSTGETAEGSGVTAVGIGAIVPAPDGTLTPFTATFSAITFVLPAGDDETIDLQCRVDGINNEDLNFGLLTIDVTSVQSPILLEIVDNLGADLISPQDGTIVASPGPEVSLTFYLRLSALVPPAGPGVNTAFAQDVKITPSIVSGFPTDLSGVVITYPSYFEADPWGVVPNPNKKALGTNIVPKVAFQNPGDGDDLGQATVEVNVSFPIIEGGGPPVPFLELSFTAEAVV